MRVLIIGTGSIGRRHMSNLRRLVPTVQFDVLREAGRNQHRDDLRDVDFVASLDEAIRRRPDLMVVANPSSLHLRPVLTAIDHGVPFYVEKPVVTKQEDLLLLQARIAGSRMPPNMVGCNLRCLPSLIELKALLESGRLGRLVRADFEAGQWLPDWRPSQDYRLGYSARSDLGGGVLLDLIHETDAAHWFLGDFDHVSGYAARVSGLEIDSDDCAALILARAGGPLVTVRLDYVSRRPVRRYSIVGDEATAVWDLSEKSLTIAAASGIEVSAMTEDAFDIPATYLAAMREMLAAAAQGRPSAQPLEEGLRALETICRTGLRSK